MLLTGQKKSLKKQQKNGKIDIVIYGKIDILSKAIGKSNKAIIGIEDINIANEILKINNGGELQWVRLKYMKQQKNQT